MTIVAPNVFPNQNKIAEVIRAAIFESLIEGQARLQASSDAWLRTLPPRNSSFNRSNTRILASSAEPVRAGLPYSKRALLSEGQG